MAKRIAFGSDHAGFSLKEMLMDHAARAGFSVQDFGTFSADSVDYPDYAHAVADCVQHGRAELGVLICGSGNGVSISANRHKGIRAALAWNEEVARLARAHNDANIIALPARFVDQAQAARILDAYLNAAFEGGRHQKRVEKIDSGC